VLWIITDQHRADVAGYEGDPFGATPSLDALAKQSVRVSELYCQAPLCVPARQSILTGQYAHTNGAFRNSSEFPPEQRTIAGAFADAGYDTALIGKSHCNTAGFQYVREFREQYDAFLEQHPDGARPGAENYRFRKSGNFEFVLTMNPENLSAGEGPRFFMEQSVVDDTLAYLKQRDPERPFFVWASFLSPHPPLYAPDSFRERFADAPLPLRGTMKEEEPGLLAVHRGRRAEQGLDEITDDQLLEITRAYYAALAWSDHCIGELLRGLAEQGLADDTLVVYTSDHGEMLGEHGLLQKRAFFDGASRVPCMLRWPGHLEAGAVRDRVAQHVDLTATVLDLAGVPPPDGNVGRSMRELLANPAAPWEDFALSELSGTAASPTVRWMMRRGRFKYEWHSADVQALFDLETDPGELHNLVDDPEHAEVVAAMRARYEAVSEATDWAVPRGR